MVRAASGAAPSNAAAVTASGPVDIHVYPFGWTRRDLRRTIALAIAALAACAFLWQVQAILPPFIIAFALAALLDPTLRYLERLGHSRGRAVAVLYGCGFIAIGGFFLLVVPLARAQIQDIIRNFNTYSSDLQASADSFLHHNAGLLQHIGIKEQHTRDFFKEKSGPVQNSVQAGLTATTALLQSAVSRVFWIIIIPIATAFFMLDYPKLRARIISLFPDAYQAHIDHMSREIVDVFSAYLRGLVKVCALYAVAAFVLFELLGVRYAVFLGLLAGTFYAVPYVGQIVTAVGAGSVAYLMPDHTVLFVFHLHTHTAAYAILVVACAIVAQNLFDQLVYPRVVGASVGLYPVVSIFALMAGATMFGIWGMLLAVPVAASLQLVLLFFFPKLTQPLSSRWIDPPDTAPQVS